MIKKKILLIMLILVCGILGYFIFIWAKYAISQKQANENAFKDWFNNIYKPSEYRGVLKYVDKQGICSTSLWIDIKGQKQPLTYVLCTCQNKNLADFIEEGDSVVKKSDETRVTFIKYTGERKIFKLPFCVTIEDD